MLSMFVCKLIVTGPIAERDRFWTWAWTEGPIDFAVHHPRTPGLTWTGGLVSTKGAERLVYQFTTVVEPPVEWLEWTGEQFPTLCLTLMYAAERENVAGRITAIDNSLLFLDLGLNHQEVHSLLWDDYDPE